jgi:hypothetical protein
MGIPISRVTPYPDELGRGEDKLARVAAFSGVVQPFALGTKSWMVWKRVVEFTALI